MREKKYTFCLVVGLLITSVCVGHQLDQRLTEQDVTNSATKNIYVKV